MRESELTKYLCRHNDSSTNKTLLNHLQHPDLKHAFKTLKLFLVGFFLVDLKYNSMGIW